MLQLLLQHFVIFIQIFQQKVSYWWGTSHFTQWRCSLELGCNMDQINRM